MAQPENLGSFFKENKALLSEYFETRLEIVRLQSIKASSKAIGNFVWILISLFLLFVIFIFGGLVLGFWLSDLTGSFIKGFGFTTLILVGLVGLIALFRKQLFINPAIHSVISKLQEDTSGSDEEENY